MRQATEAVPAVAATAPAVANESGGGDTLRFKGLAAADAGGTGTAAVAAAAASAAAGVDTPYNHKLKVGKDKGSTNSMKQEMLLLPAAG